LELSFKLIAWPHFYRQKQISFLLYVLQMYQLKNRRPPDTLGLGGIWQNRPRPGLPAARHLATRSALASEASSSLRQFKHTYKFGKCCFQLPFLFLSEIRATNAKK